MTRQSIRETADPRYRYTLRRYISPDLRTLLWVMLNPSTADEEKDDPTIRRVMQFTEREGYGRLSVVNLFAKRATDPRLLFDGTTDPTGPQNGLTLFREIQRASAVVVAWGSFYGSLPAARRYVERPNVEAIAAHFHKPVHCLGTTQAGHPRHPLYLPAGTHLVPWSNVGNEVVVATPG